jgi:hypothetical protein
MYIRHNWLPGGRSRGSSVSIVSDYGLDNQGPIPDKDRIFLLASASRPALGPTQPPVQWIPRVISPGRDADHSPPSSADVENE